MIALELDAVTKVYGVRRAVDALSLRVPVGAFLGLLGRNGAGKSTTLKMVTGLARPTSGTIRVFGREVTGDAIDVKREVGVMPEDMALLDMLTGPEYLRFVGRMHGLEDAVIARRQAELFATLDLSPGPGTLVVDYSFGMKKKLSLCSAVLHGPRMLFLDEPFEGIDPVTGRTIKEILGGLQRRGVTLVLTSHVLEIVERLCPLIAVLDHGKLVGYGPLEEIRGAGGSLEAAFVDLVAGNAVPKGELSWLVSPVRALLEAHVAAVVNRMRRESSRNGAWVFGALLVVVVGTSVLPALIGLAVGGVVLGGALPDPFAASIAGMLLSALGLFGGLVSGTLGGTRQLAWESYRTFPLRQRDLLVAEVVAGIGDLVPLLLSVGAFTLLGAVVAGKPVVAPIALVLGLETLLSVLLLQLVVGGLAAALVKRVRVALVGVLLVAWVGSSLPLMVERAGVVAVGHQLRRVGEALPLTYGALGLADAAHGAWLTALGRQAYPLAFIAALAAIASVQLGRELASGAPSGIAAGSRSFRFRSASSGVAELHFRVLLDSPVGRFGLVLPFVTVFLVRGPFAEMLGRTAWVVPASFSYVTLSSMHFQTSLFGLDGHGVKALFTLPLRARDILDGKIRGLLKYQAIQIGLLTVLLALFQRPSPRELVAGVFLALASFGVQVSLGQFTSSWMPRAIARRAAQKSGVPLPLLVVSSGSWVGVSFGLSVAYTQAATRAPHLLVPGMAALAAAGLGALVATRARASRYLDASRERIIERIGG